MPRKKPNLPPKNCALCGNEFKPKIGKQLYCSTDCGRKKWTQENPERVLAIQRRNEAKRKGKNRYKPEQAQANYRKRMIDPEYRIRINEKAVERINNIRKFMRRYKLFVGCVDCGYKKHHAALDFDHVRGVKKFNVCNAKSIKSAKEEIRKCEVVCANCHRKRTYMRSLKEVKAYDL